MATPVPNLDGHGANVQLHEWQRLLAVCARPARAQRASGSPWHGRASGFWTSGSHAISMSSGRTTVPVLDARLPPFVRAPVAQITQTSLCLRVESSGAAGAAEARPLPLQGPATSR